MSDEVLADWLVNAFPNDLGYGLRWSWLIREGESPNLMWWHPCPDKSKRARWIDITSGNFHHLVCADPLTIEASVLCEFCGLHGWIRNGQWVPA